MADQAQTQSYVAPSYAGVSSYGMPLTPQQLRAQLAMSMLKEGTDTSPIRSGWQGAARLAQALMGGLAYNQLGQPNAAANAAVAAEAGNVPGAGWTPPGMGTAPAAVPPAAPAAAAGGAPDVYVPPGDPRGLSDAGPAMNPPNTPAGMPPANAGAPIPANQASVAPRSARDQLVASINPNFVPAPGAPGPTAPPPVTAGTDPGGSFGIGSAGLIQPGMSDGGPGAPPAPRQAAAPPAPGAPAAPGGDFYRAAMMHESGGRNIPNGAGGAAGGYYQFMPQTWSGIAAQHPELGLPSTPMAASYEQQTAAYRALTQGNAAQLTAAGLPVTDKNVFMGSFLGGKAPGFINAMNQDPSAPAASMYPAEARSNPTIFFATDARGNPIYSQPKSLSDVYGRMTNTFSAGNTTGFGPQSAGMVAGPGAPSSASTAPAYADPPPVVAGAALTALNSAAPPAGSSGAADLSLIQPQGGQGGSAPPPQPPPMNSPSFGASGRYIPPAPQIPQAGPPMQLAQGGAPPQPPQMPTPGNGIGAPGPSVAGNGVGAPGDIANANGVATNPFQNVASMFGMSNPSQPQQANSPTAAASAGPSAQSMRNLAAIFTNPDVYPETRAWAKQMYDTEAAYLAPHPTHYQAIPGSNNERELDWLERPTGRILQGGPRLEKSAPGETISQVGVDASGNATLTPVGGDPNGGVTYAGSKAGAEETAKRAAVASTPGAADVQGFRDKVQASLAGKEYAQALPTWNAMTQHVMGYDKSSDKAIVDDFQKILNPGMGVRQGAFNLTLDAQSLVDKAQGIIAGWTEGGPELSPMARATLMQAAKVKMDAYQQAFQPDLDGNRRIAEKWLKGNPTWEADDAMPQFAPMAPVTPFDKIATQRIEGAPPAAAAPPAPAPMPTPTPTAKPLPPNIRRVN